MAFDVAVRVARPHCGGNENRGNHVYLDDDVARAVCSDKGGFTFAPVLFSGSFEGESSRSIRKTSATSGSDIHNNAPKRMYGVPPRLRFDLACALWPAADQARNESCRRPGGKIMHEL
mmetsp:Transcript_35418/g.61206  ORF Transcript_35418/g.61206 Transcript_35418/m.61206 type:complete len:118 (-) Transcript_35418:504-857(-)